MSLEAAPIARKGGGWVSPGLTSPRLEPTDHTSRSRGSSPGASKAPNPGPPTWASARASSARVRAGSGIGRIFLTQWILAPFARLMRHTDSSRTEHGAEKEKLDHKRRTAATGGFGLDNFRWEDAVRRCRPYITRTSKRNAGVILALLLVWWFATNPLTQWYRRTSFLGGGSKFVIILAANPGGGVSEVKGAREWAIESISLRNKKQYATRWGYALEVANMVEKKQYSHEWRAGWEKVDIIQKAMRKHRNAEWFWWLDLNTIIMEPSYSLQSHIFNSVADRTYRDINVYNPQKIEHPPSNTSGSMFFLDATTLSATGDNLATSIDFIMAQDCGGFSLGSFFVRRSEWSERILDAWWDPIAYEQRHMQWTHKEQDAFQHIYTAQPWIRSRVAFLPQRMINAYPEGACGNDKVLPSGGCPKELRKIKFSDPALALPEHQNTDTLEAMKECGVHGVHYQVRERDFLANMAGCEFGRECAEEMEDFAELSVKLNRGRLRKVWDRVAGNERRDREAMIREKERRQKVKEEWERAERIRKGFMGAA